MIRVASSASLQAGLAQMLKGGVIMDVTSVEEARIAEEAGAVAVMALERVPADIRKQGEGVVVGAGVGAQPRFCRAAGA